MCGRRCQPTGGRIPSWRAWASSPVTREAMRRRRSEVDWEAIRLTGVVLVQDLFTAGRSAGWRQLVLPHTDDGVRVQDILVVLVARPTAAMARRGAAATGWRR